jgi:mTERF domain-containing protein, mitochondrial
LVALWNSLGWRSVWSLDTEYNVHRSTLLGFSMKNRLVPWNYVLKVLKTKGLVKKDIEFYGVANMSEKRFTMRFVEHYSVTIPRLEGAYAAACAGQVPPEI